METIKADLRVILYKYLSPPLCVCVCDYGSGVVMRNSNYYAQEVNVFFVTYFLPTEFGNKTLL